MAKNSQRGGHRKAELGELGTVCSADGARQSPRKDFLASAGDVRAVGIRLHNQVSLHTEVPVASLFPSQSLEAYHEKACGVGTADKMRV